MIVLTDKHRVPFQIDDVDHEAVSRYSWCLLTCGYPATAVGKGSLRRVVTLHEFLLGAAPVGLEWDHINRDKLDNRRSNLRVVSHAVNNRNKGKRKDNATGVIGVCRYKRDGTFQVDIGGKFLGRFSTLEEARRVRLNAEHRYWGSDR
jgi:hypothetical protein